MSFVMQNLKKFPVQIGDLLIDLSGYQISQSSSLKESGTTDGSNLLTACWEMGIRIKLKGKIVPSQTPEQVIYALSQAMLISQNFAIRDLLFSNAMLCGYTITENQEIPEISLLFYTNQKPVLMQDDSEQEEILT
ncbi:MAG: hypothetical protein K2J88_01220 [Oscillospiraceae bacterium]|nr:hypothetical protein [Oscillospiraceae bacterium]